MRSPAPGRPPRSTPATIARRGSRSSGRSGPGVGGRGHGTLHGVGLTMRRADDTGSRMAQLACWLLVAVPCFALAQDQAGERRTLVVSGQGEVRATPDRAQLSFTVETTATKAVEAAAESARRSAAVGAAVRPLLGAGGTVATTRYSIEPRYETSRPAETREPRWLPRHGRDDISMVRTRWAVAAFAV